MAFFELAVFGGVAYLCPMNAARVALLRLYVAVNRVRLAAKRCKMAYDYVNYATGTVRKSVPSLFPCHPSPSCGSVAPTTLSTTLAAGS